LVLDIGGSASGSQCPSRAFYVWCEESGNLFQRVGTCEAAAMATTKVQRIMTQPINLIFRFLQSKSRIQFWLFEQKDMRIEGRIIGFDEYMNLVLDEAEEISLKKKTRKPLGRILLKGDNITLMMNTGK
jgi:small nuclear ribonucleoprotein E